MQGIQETPQEAVMEILILGSGTGVPTRKRFSPGMVLSHEHGKILIDPSAGTQKRLIEEGIDSRDIDMILISHFHPDHCGDLIPLLFRWKSDVLPRTNPLTIAGPKGLRHLYTALCNAYELEFASDNYPITWKELNPGKRFLYNKLQIISYPVPHAKKSIGFRIQDTKGKVIAYTGDTDESRDLLRLCKNVDLLIMECSFPEKYKVQGHLIPSLAGSIAARSNCKKLLLTHFYPVIDKDEVVTIVTNIYNGTLYLAKDGMSVFV